MTNKDAEKQYTIEDKDEARKAKAFQKAQEQQSREEMRYLLSLPQFRRFAWELLQNTHLFKSSFTGNSETFFREGERNVGLRVYARIQEADPAAYAVMVKENG